MQADFYYTPKQTAIPTLIGLLGKVLSQHQRAVVITGDGETTTQLDDALWRVEKFLPHSADHLPERQPIWLQSDQPSSGAKIANGAKIAIYYAAKAMGEIPNLAKSPTLERAVFLNFSDDPTQCQIAKQAWEVLANSPQTTSQDAPQTTPQADLKAHSLINGKWQTLTEPL